MAAKPTKTQVYQTILVLCLALLLAFGYWRKEGLAGMATGLLFIAIFIYPAAVWIHQAWMQLAHGLAWFNTRLLLGLLFFLILTPLAFLRRLFSSNEAMPLEPNDDSSYYIDREEQTINFEQPW